MKLQINGVTIEYEDSGPSDRPAVLLIAGLGMQLINWPDEFVQGLVDQGLRVIRFDNRDGGLSQRFDHAPEQFFLWQFLRMQLRLPLHPAYTLQDMAQDALGLLDALGIERAHIVGVSMGGMIGQRMAVTAPARTLSLTSIMSSTHARGLPLPHWDVVRVLNGFLPSKVRGLDENALIKQCQDFIETIAGRGVVYDEAQLRALTTVSVRRAFNAGGMMRQTLAILADTGLRAKLLSRIRCPTLVLHGERDPFLPIEHGRDTARRIPGARFVGMPGSGHELTPHTIALILREMVPFIKSVQIKAQGSA
ncbi:MAG: alpha/beta fold hydrolase [Burkholderiaceae bacterium]|jgi:pimeloyl-ACP methyl ester carboxylesterase|nr:alpha/beta fold hydrolase [Burkholderiaceae bacterium]